MSEEMYLAKMAGRMHLTNCLRLDIQCPAGVDAVILNSMNDRKAPNIEPGNCS